MSEADRRLTEIADRLSKVSPGEWYVDKEIDGVYADKQTVIKRRLLPDESIFVPTRIMSVGQTRRHNHRNCENNVAFLGNAKADVAFLLAEVYRLRGELKAKDRSGGW